MILKAKIDGPVALIPAYKPEPVLIGIVKDLLSSDHFAAIICVDDGSGDAYSSIFTQIEELGVRLIRHYVNLGKGAALGAGIDYIGCHYPKSVGLVTLVCRL